jgi:hypothetical protein
MLSGFTGLSGIMNPLIRFPLARLMKRPEIPDEALDILHKGWNL